MNMSRVSLATGQVRMGEDGRVKGFDVNGGDIEIGAGGLNAKGVSYLDFIAGKVSIGGEVRADGLAMVLGNNRVAYDSGEVEEVFGSLASSGAYALDVSELGSVEAGSIYMKSTGKGTGVRVAGNMAASAGSITFAADGKMQLKSKISARRGGVSVESSSDQIQIGASSRVSGEFVSLQAGTAIVNEGGRVDAGKHLYLRAGDLGQSEEGLDNGPDGGDSEGLRGIIKQGGGCFPKPGSG